MSEEVKQQPWQDKVTKELNEIRDILKNKYNMQPATDAEGKILPPPTVFDLSLRDLGKNTLTH